MTLTEEADRQATDEAVSTARRALAAFDAGRVPVGVVLWQLATAGAAAERLWDRRWPWLEAR